MGQWGRDLKRRVSEHKKAILTNTGFTDHCLQHNHFIDTKNITLLHNVQKGKKMDLLEILEIRKAIKNNKNLTNEQTEFCVSFSLN